MTTPRPVSQPDPRPITDEEMDVIKRAAGNRRVPFEATAHWEADRPVEVDPRPTRRGIVPDRPVSQPEHVRHDDWWCKCGSRAEDCDYLQEKERPVSQPAEREQGIYHKFDVKRREDPTGKHIGCSYFVVDLNHDRHARPALAAYADACEADNPELARDLRAMFND